MDKTLQIRNGMILNNPFYRSVEDSPSGLWVVQNRSRVENKIRRTLTEMGCCDFELDECYDRMAYYFIEHSHNEFNADYFKNKGYMERIEEAKTQEELDQIIYEMGREGDKDNDYKMEYYILSRVRTETLAYIRVIRQLKNNARLRSDTDRSEQGYTADKGSITESLASYRASNLQVNIGDKPDLYAEYEELQNILDYDLHIYDEEFSTRGLRDFSTLKFVQALFLKDFETDEERAEYLGINYVLYNQHLTGFMTLLKGETGEGGMYEDLKNSIYTLLDGLAEGWTPIIR